MEKPSPDQLILGSILGIFVGIAVASFVVGLALALLKAGS